MAGGADPSPRTRGGTGHRRRRAARRVAVDILFQADVTGASPAEALRGWREAGREVPEYAEEVVTGVEREMPGIDAVLAAHSEEWTVSRMATVDRTILRVAVFEIGSGIPAAVAISEAVEAANELSTEASGRFVNGVLGRIAREGDQVSEEGEA